MPRLRPMAVSLAFVLLGTTSTVGAQSGSKPWWYDVHGSIEGTYSATCESDFPKQAGKVRFAFQRDDDPDGYIASSWYPSPLSSEPTPSIGKVAADGTASGDGRLMGNGTYYGTFIWSGQFRRASDGSIEASGGIRPNPDWSFGCTGTWTASKGPDPVRANPPIAAPTGGGSCAEYLARIQSSAEDVQRGLEALASARSKVRDVNKLITALRQKAPIRREDFEDPPDDVNSYLSRPVEYWETDWRVKLMEGVERIRKKLGQTEAAHRALRSEARAAGCDVSRDDPLSNYFDVDLEPDVLTAMDVQDNVSIEKRGNRTPLRNGTEIRLTPGEPVTIITDPFSSATIQIGPVRKAIAPNTKLTVFPRSDGKPDYLERGGGLFDISQPTPMPVETPTATVNADGTIFTVSYSIRTRTTGIGVEEGRVTVYPTNRNLREITLTVGQYVEVSMVAVSPVLDAPGATITTAQPRPAQQPPANVDPNPNPQATTRAADLTGLWVDDTGQLGIYRVRQQGNEFYWVVDGTAKGSYVNMAFGTISGNVINARWIDLPGSPSLGGGSFTLRIESNNRIVKVSTEVGNYGAQVWTRQGTSTTAGRNAERGGRTTSLAETSVWQYEIFSQAEWKGTWTRRGTSDLYDVSIKDIYRNPITAVDQITFQGNRVYTRRIQSSDPQSLNCTGEGELQANGHTYIGTSNCPNGPSGWQWRIAPAGKPF